MCACGGRGSSWVVVDWQEPVQVRIQGGLQFGWGERSGCADGVQHEAVGHGEQQPGLQGGIEVSPRAWGRDRRAQCLLQVRIDRGELSGRLKRGSYVSADRQGRRRKVSA